MKMAIMRIGRAELRVLDLEESINYYTNIIGLEVVGRSEGRAYLKAWDEYDHHSLVLQEADSPGLDHFAFKVQMKRILSITKDRIEQFGCTTKRISKGTRLAEGEAIRCYIANRAPNGTLSRHSTSGQADRHLNPHPCPDEARGMAPHRLDHVLLIGEDVKTVTRLFTEALGIFQSERVRRWMEKTWLEALCMPKMERLMILPLLKGQIINCTMQPSRLIIGTTC